MNPENKYTSYSAADIKRYLAGDMLPADMHALEMAALDDPLLADAIDGFNGMEQKDWSIELASLKEQLNQKQQSKLVPVAGWPAYRWWRAAAAILIVGVAGGTAYLVTAKKDKINTPIATISAAPDSITANNGAIAKGVEMENQTSQDTAAPMTEVTTIAPSSALSTDRGTLLANNTEKYKTDKDSSFIYRPGTASAYEVAANNDDAKDSREYKTQSEEIAAAPVAGLPTNNSQLNEAFADNNIASVQKQEEFYNKNRLKMNGATAGTYTAQVVTPDKKAIGFANVMLPENKKPIHTDANGKFVFKSPDTAVKVTVTSPGYNSQQVVLSRNQPATGNTIVLEPLDVETDKIAMSKRKELAKKIMPAAADSTEEEEEDEDAAEPFGGWAQYNNYLSNNMVRPATAGTKNIHGEVEVFVNLSGNGEVSAVKVAKPLCPECDAEALRLIKQGPKFDLKNKKSKKVKVTVKF